MRIATGGSVQPALVRSLEPVLNAVGLCAGPDGGACLYDDGGSVVQAQSALDIVRQVAGSNKARGPAALILRETLFDAERDLGDGGARLALLLGGLFREGVRLIAAGVSAPALADALLALGRELERALQSTAVAASDEDALAAVATAAGASPAVAADIARMLIAGGTNGHAEIVAGSERSVRIETGAGFIFEAQPLAEIFAGAAFDPVHVLVADEIIDDFGPLVPLLEAFATRGKSLLVVARDVTGSALQTLVANHRDNGLRTAALKPAAVSQQAADTLEDLAIVTGATLVADRFGSSLANLRPAMLGRAARFSIGQGRALLEAPAGHPDSVAQRRRLLLAEAERQKYLALDKERLERRAARLSGRWARLYIGEATARETQTALAVARRASASARMAFEGGAAPGGGLAFLRAFDALPASNSSDPLAPETAARQCLGLALAELVGVFGDRGEAQPQRLRRLNGGTLEEMVSAGDKRREGLLDPLPLLRQVMRRAVSGAAVMLRVDAILGS